MIEIELTVPEIERAARAGLDARLRGLAGGWRQRIESGGNWMAWANHINGSLGEYCVAKWLGGGWQGMRFDTRGEGDVGRVEVRTTINEKEPQLVVYQNDEPARLFVLVVGQGPKWKIAGYERAKNAMLDCYKMQKYANGPPQFFVPVSKLRTDFAWLREWMLKGKAA